MTTIKHKYIGITHPIQEILLDNEVFCESWKVTNCANGIHAFDEVLSLKNPIDEPLHYLHCDVCGMEVHINKIVIPDGKDDEIGDE